MVNKLKWVASNANWAKVKIILLVSLITLLGSGCVITKTGSGEKCPLYGDVEEYSKQVWAGIWEKWDWGNYATSDYLEKYDPMDHISLIKDEADAGLYPPPTQQTYYPNVNLGFPFEADGFKFDLRAGPFDHNVDYFIAYVLEYTLPEQPCDSTINWEAPLQLAFPQGIYADESHLIELEWLVSISPASDYHLPQFALELLREPDENDFRLPSQGVEWRILDQTEIGPIYKTEIIDESTFLPANVTMNLFLGVSIRVHSLGGGFGLPMFGCCNLGSTGTYATFQIKNGVEYEVIPTNTKPGQLNQ